MRPYVDVHHDDPARGRAVESRRGGVDRGGGQRRQAAIKARDADLLIADVPLRLDARVPMQLLVREHVPRRLCGVLRLLLPQPLLLASRAQGVLAPPHVVEDIGVDLEFGVGIADADVLAGVELAAARRTTVALQQTVVVRHHAHTHHGAREWGQPVSSAAPQLHRTADQHRAERGGLSSTSSGRETRGLHQNARRNELRCLNVRGAVEDHKT